MKDKHVKVIYLNKVMESARIRFTRKCLVKIVLNNELITDKIASAADLHTIFTPIAPNYSLN